MGHGGSEVGLTERGSKMARLLGIRLSEVDFKFIYSSDLHRAQQTTKIIYNECKLLSENAVEPVYLSEIREKCLGILEGKDPKTYKEEVRKKGVSMREFKPEAGESWIDVFIRAKNFLNTLIKKFVKQDFIDPELQNLESSSINNLSKHFSDTVKVKESKMTYKNNIIKSNMIRNKTIYDNLKVSNELKRDITISGGLVDDSFVEDEKFQYIKNNEINLSKSKTKSTNTKTNTNTNSTSNKGFMYSDVEKYEYFFLTKNIDEIITDVNIKKYIQTQYLGFNISNNSKKILIVTHGGFIMEMMNLIRIRKGISIKTSSDSKLSSVYVVRIYCYSCGGICYSKSKSCNLEYDLLAYNNVHHLGKKIKIEN
jgi:broad specificity phosphatase PhoE